MNTQPQIIKSKKVSVHQLSILLLLTIEIIIFLLFITENTKYILLGLGSIAAGIIILQPILGLSLSSIVAYSGISSNLLQGLFLPIILLTVLSWILYLIRNKKMTLIHSQQNLLFILWGALMIFSSFYALDFEKSMTSIYEFSKYLIFYFLIINILDSLQSIRYFMWLLVLTGFFMLIYGIYYSYFTSHEIPILRLISFVDDPNSFAIKLIPLIAFSYALIKTEKRILLKTIGIICMSSLIFATILTFSRGGIFGLAVVLFLTAWQELRKKRNLLIVIIIIIIIFLLIPKEIFLARFTNFEEIKMDASVVQRLRLLKGGTSMFLDHIFLGVGIGNFIVYSQDYCNTIYTLVAHNSFLHIAAETGLVGLTLFLLLLFKTFKDQNTCMRYNKTDQNVYLLTKSINIAFIGFLAHSMFLSEHFNISLFVIIALTVCLKNLHDNQKEPTQ